MPRNKKYQDIESHVTELENLLQTLEVGLDLDGSIDEYSQKAIDKTQQALASGELKLGYPSDFTEEERILCDVMVIFKLQGNTRLRKGVSKALAKLILFRKYYPNLISEMVENTDRQNMSAIASKPRKDFKDEAVQIMRDTWEKYPSVRQADMAAAIYEKFKSKGFSPSRAVDWIQELGLNPKVYGKKTPFHLVIK